MRLIMIIFYLLLIIIGISFAALNAQLVPVNFYLKTISMPVALLMTLMLGLGMLVGFILLLLKYWRLKMEYHKIKNQLKMTEQEIKNLRSIPLHN